jgi:DNA polymerase I-like protein with 3'-5' exonuclease and polymerase domains
MRLIQTADLTPTTLKSQTERDMVYNGLDCCVTLEVLEALLPQLDETTEGSYRRSLALQAPILEMNMRGTLIDQEAREQAIVAYRVDREKLQRNFHRIAEEVFCITPEKGSTVWGSPKKLMELFYQKMKVPPVKKRNQQGQYVPTVNREALERLRAYFHAKPLVDHILALRDIGKKLGFLSTEIDNDGRIRTSFNIAGTTTFRLASSLSDFGGTGTNLQNIERRLRKVFVPDEGFKFANIDLEQADARNVGAIIATLFNEYSFLDACESGDLHTTVCKLAWFELPWTGEPKRDRAIADQIAYRDLSYRDLSKKLGHGTNYYGKPHTMSRHTKLSQDIIKSFQSKYFGAFPISRWHDWVRAELAKNGALTTLYGRRRHFFGRRNDDSTLREAIAYCPQSMTADQINQALLNIWQHAPHQHVQLLIQVHDSILLQYRESKEKELLPLITSLMGAPLTLPSGRVFNVPHEVKVGWNWADASAENPQGLVKFNGIDTRKREARKTTHILDRVLLRSD